MRAEYPQSFLEWLAKRTPNVRRRILRLNPMPLDVGARLRGYHPHARSTDRWRAYIGKRDFIKTWGREAWIGLPRCAIEHRGHRKAVTQEAVQDQLWMAPSDHYIRSAVRRKGQWVIPIQLPAGHDGPVVVRMGAAP